MRMLAVIAALSMLAACGEAPRDAAPKRETAKPSAMDGKLMALDEEQRNGVLAKAIAASGATGCQSVLSAERATMMNGHPGWKAECDDSTSHLIELLDDGTARVTSRTH